jgi:glycolate oxidase FAD binding subunit
MTSMLKPSSLSELVEAVRSTPKIVVVGGGTKPRLAEVGQSFTRLSIVGLSGIVEYEPDEFTVTALAGTRLAQIESVLHERGQYLPFDPMWVEAGSTLGGAVASGANGPGRFRFGGVRDFVLGVRFVDGTGRLLRMGAKVVKNAAGFDLPKFFVGSLGRFGLLAEITLKVFPKPLASLTLALNAAQLAEVSGILTGAARGRWELDALDLPSGRHAVCARLAGPEAALPPLAEEILNHWPGRILPSDEAQALWTELREARWRHPNGVMAKVALTPAHLERLLNLVRSSPDGRVQVSAGGNVAWISLPSADGVPLLDDCLKVLGLSGLTLIGPAPLWLGVKKRPQIAHSLKDALDPQHRYPGLDD